jgi:hypothetical protein
MAAKLLILLEPNPQKIGVISKICFGQQPLEEGQFRPISRADPTSPFSLLIKTQKH